jgi:hypothetical protein
MAKVRTDKTEYLKRIYTIQGWIVEGIQSALIVRQILNNNWCSSQRHAERMMKAARDLWTEIPEAELEQKRKIKIAELQQYKRSLKDQYKGTPAGIRALVAIDKEIILLEGMRKAVKMELSGEGGTPLIPPAITINQIITDKTLEIKENES